MSQDGVSKNIRGIDSSLSFLQSLGFPRARILNPLSHFDFLRRGMRMMVVGPMGSGKTEYSSRIWRDSLITLEKSSVVQERCTNGGADSRRVFFVRFSLDASRFAEYPEDAIPYRGGFVRCGSSIAQRSNSFGVEKLVEEHPSVGTWILDEASFYDERLSYVVHNLSEFRGLNFIFPTLILNFRKDIFNSTARFLLDSATDVLPLTAYCEHPDCIENSFYTYRYYLVDRQECPALYFDPLIIIGGDKQREGWDTPNYSTRCSRHHYLPGKEYTFLTLKPLGEEASRGDSRPLRDELYNMKTNLKATQLYRHMVQQYVESPTPEPFNMNALKVPFIAEKALIYLFAEQNLVSEVQMKKLTAELSLEKGYMTRILSDNRRNVDLEQKELTFSL